jgi:hypothetical protein
MTIWRSLVAWLAAVSADPSAVAVEDARCQAAVIAAYAAAAPDSPAPGPKPPAPAPNPPGGKCPVGCKCGGSGGIPNGRVVEPCPCPASCSCKAAKGVPPCEKCKPVPNVSRQAG